MEFKGPSAKGRIDQDGTFTLQTELFDEHPDVTHALQANTHTEYLDLVSKISCSCCPIGRGVYSNVEGSGKKPVAFGGSQNPKVVFIGEAPGRNEWEGGTPFVGESGTLLRSIIANEGIKPIDIAFLNICMCRPAYNVGNTGYMKDRAPFKEEVDACIVHLYKQLSLLKPTIIVAVGRTSAQSLFGLKAAVPIEQVNGMTFQIADFRFDEKPVYGFITYHPAACLRARDPNGSKRITLSQDIRKLSELIPDPEKFHMLLDPEVWTRSSIVTGRKIPV